MNRRILLKIWKSEIMDEKMTDAFNELASRVAMLEKEVRFLRAYCFEHVETVLLPKCYVKVSDNNSLEVITPQEYESLDEQARAGFRKMGIDTDEEDRSVNGNEDEDALQDIEMWHTYKRGADLPVGGMMAAGYRPDIENCGFWLYDQSALDFYKFDTNENSGFGKNKKEGNENEKNGRKD